MNSREMREGLAIGFHAVTFLQYAFAVFYDYTYTIVPHNVTSVHNAYGGKFKFLTFWDAVSMCDLAKSPDCDTYPIDTADEITPVLRRRSSRTDRRSLSRCHRDPVTTVAEGNEARFSTKPSSRSNSRPIRNR